MMRLKIIGVGAAGNKAAINILEKKICTPRDVVLINSTLRDIPNEYRDYAIRLSDNVQGCGQERDLAKDICIDAIAENRINIENLIDPEYDKVVIITSTNGGTGSGASVILADAIRETLEIEVEIIGLVGFFDESARALRNLIEFCKDLDDGYTVQLISNGAYLRECRDNRTKAELLANDEVANRILAMSGMMMIDSFQNIDDTDIVKINNRHGYKCVEYMEIDGKIRNRTDFDDILTEMLDQSPSIDPEGDKVAGLGIILNVNPYSQKFIDKNSAILRERFGEPYEVFAHIQYAEQYPQFIAVIASGMAMPEKQIKEVFDKYQEMASKINREKESFFDNLKQMSFEDDFDFYKGDGEVNNLKISAAEARKNAWLEKMQKKGSHSSQEYNDEDFDTNDYHRKVRKNNGNNKNNGF